MSGPRDRRPPPRAWTRTTISLLALAVLVAVPACGTATPGRPGVTDAVQVWLARYVLPDGRVSRLDQGGDTVSEGQSYALALALAADDAALFDRVWEWTRVHLQRSDALLAFHAGPDGTVLDPTPAPDADLLTAWALLHAGPRHASAGQHLADAVLAEETARLQGRLVLTAGPWANGEPLTLNPSYWALPVLRDLARMTNDARFDELADTAVGILAGLPDPLPPDWVAVSAGVPRAEPAPDGSTPGPQYGPDAQRVLLWSAYSCSAGDRRVAQRAAAVLRDGAATGALSSDLNGNPLRPEAAALPRLAAAAARSAVGDTKGADLLRRDAQVTARRYPTYYGDAWLALDASRAVLHPSC